MANRSTKRRPRIVCVIASRADLERAVRMRRPPDLFELRLDRLAGMADQVERALPKLRRPLIITARDPHEGGANRLRLRQRRDLLVRFLNHADYIDVELRLASALRSLLKLAQNNNVRRIISFHNFKSTPSERILAAKAREAESHGADIFKVATRTDTPVELGRLVEFISKNRVDVPLAVMGIGKLGAISRVLLARAGSVLIYASVGAGTDVEGQLSLEQLRALGFGQRQKRNVIPSEVENGAAGEAATWTGRPDG
jgi:3-dehydroquinate dehydratase I